MILADERALYVTALSGLGQRFGGPYPLAAVLFVVAILATIALFVARKSPVGTLLLLLPQQCVLVLSAGGAVDAMVLSQFADGVVRPRAFLMADQFPIVLATVMHTVAILDHYADAVVRRARMWILQH